MVKKEVETKEEKLENNSENKLKYGIIERKCLKCNSRNTYTIKDGTIICRKCGQRTIPKERVE